MVLGPTQLMLLPRTYDPSPALAPYILRHYVFAADLPDSTVIEDFLLAETAFVRCLLEGDWTFQNAAGEWLKPDKMLFFGANAKPLKVRVRGSFVVAGCTIRPGGWNSLFAGSHQDYTDKLLPLSRVWGSQAAKLQLALENADTDEARIAAMELYIRKQLDDLGQQDPDLAMAQFERISLRDSKIKVEDAASLIGLSVRQLERRCCATFGLTPKAVLRRSRYLDIAAAKRGFGSPSERDLAELRYFDQSHLNREFRRFTRMTPGQFERTATPLHTAGLKLREESRFED